MIIVKNLSVSCNIGLGKKERKISQTLYIDLYLYPKLSIKELKDDIRKTIDYAEVCEKIRKFAKTSSSKLIETFAKNLLDLLLKNKNISKAKVIVKKKIIPGCDYVAVCTKKIKK